MSYCVCIVHQNNAIFRVASVVELDKLSWVWEALPWKTCIWCNRFEFDIWTIVSRGTALSWTTKKNCLWDLIFSKHAPKWSLLFLLPITKHYHSNLCDTNFVRFRYTYLQYGKRVSCNNAFQKSYANLQLILKSRHQPGQIFDTI